MGEEVWPCLLYPVNPVLRSRRGADDLRDKKHADGLFFTWFKCHCSIPGEIEMFLIVSCAREKWKLKWKRGWGRDCEPRAVSERVGEAGKGLAGLWADNYVWSLAGRRVDNLGLFGNSALFLDNDQSHRLTGSWPLENTVFCQLRVEAGEQVLEYQSPSFSDWYSSTFSIVLSMTQCLLWPSPTQAIETSLLAALGHINMTVLAKSCFHKGFLMLLKNHFHRASLVVPWLRIHLAMEGTLVWSLVQEDPTCLRTTKPAHVPQLQSLCPGAREPQLLSPCITATEAHTPQILCSKTRETTTMSSPRTTKE